MNILGYCKTPSTGNGDFAYIGLLYANQFIIAMDDGTLLESWRAVAFNENRPNLFGIIKEILSGIIFIGLSALWNRGDPDE